MIEGVNPPKRGVVEDIEDSQLKTSRSAEGCSSCGATGVGGVLGCDAVFADLIGREFADPAFYRSHRLTVDSYCLQHPERYMISTKSAAAHLAGICWSLEVGESLHLPAPLKRFVDGPRTFDRVAAPPPLHRGRINLTYLLPIRDSEEYLEAAREWARSVWAAWAVGQEQAREWVAEARSS